MKYQFLSRIKFIAITDINCKTRITLIIKNIFHTVPRKTKNPIVATTFQEILKDGTTKKTLEVHPESVSRDNETAHNPNGYLHF